MLLQFTLRCSSSLYIAPVPSTLLQFTLPCSSLLYVAPVHSTLLQFTWPWDVGGLPTDNFHALITAVLNASQRTGECWLDQNCQGVECEASWAVLRVTVPYENVICTILHLVWFQLTDQGLIFESAHKYCGVELPPVYVSSGNNMRVMFRGVSPPAPGGRRGFLLTYSAKTSAAESPDTTAEPSSTGKSGLVCASSHQILCSCSQTSVFVLSDHPCRT